jgi:hypothetical protein
VSITKMTYSLSTGMPPTVPAGGVRRGLLQQALHLGRELLVRGHELGLHDVATAASVLLAWNCPRTFVRSPCIAHQPLPLAREVDDAALQLAVELVGLAADHVELLLQPLELALQRWSCVR